MPAVAYHCHAKVISRTKGQSAVASAAYRTGQRLEDERYGKVQDFSRKAGVEFVWHAVPAGAPEWAQDVAQTWNEVERAEVRRNSTLAREYVAAFPSLLNAQQREWMLKDWVREEFTRKGLIATAVIHAPDKNGDERNYHTHVMVAERPVDGDGWRKHKDRSLISRETLVEIKERWAELGARQLERAGYEVEAERWRHGHKTLKQQEAAALERGDLAYVEQVREREATTHVGHVASAIERKGRVSERGELNREVEARNAERKEIDVDLAAVRQELERLVAEPIAERVEVDSLAVVGEPRRSNERHLEKAEEGLRDVGDSEKADCIRLYRGIGKNVLGLEGAPFDGVYFSTNIERAREFGEVHFVDVTPEELGRYKCPHSKRILDHEPIAKDDYRIDDLAIIGRLRLLSTEKEREDVTLASIDPQPQAQLSWTQAQEVVTKRANERGSIPIDRFEAVPSAWEIGRGAEAAVDVAEGVVSTGAEMVLGAGEALAMWLEAALGGASRKAPGGAEYVPPSAAGPPPPVVEKPAWLQEKDKLRTTSGVEATQDQAVKSKVEEKQGQSHAEVWAEMRRANEKAARERAELYRDRDDDGDRDRER